MICKSCTNSTSNNTLQNYGPWIASSPVGCQTSSLDYEAKSGSAAIISSYIFDAYHQTVQSWPQLAASLQCVAAYSNQHNQPFLVVSALSGTTVAQYFNGSAVFSSVSVSGPIGAVFALQLELTSPSSFLSLAGSHSVVPWTCVKNISVTILPCDPVEQFDSTANRCVCVPDSGRIQLEASSTGPCVCLPTFYWDTGLQACAPCPEGAYCSGGAIYSTKGWWRASAPDPRTFSCRPGYCSDEFQAAFGQGFSGAALSDGELTTAGNTLALPAGGSACAEGHSGPLCAVCNPGWTLQGDACKVCPPGAAWGAWAPWRRGVLLAGVLVSIILGVFVGFVMQLLPELQKHLARCDGR